MAHFLDVSTHALTVPDIDTYIGLMHTFFALEDMYGLKIDEVDGEVVLRLDKSDYSTYTSRNVIPLLSSMTRMMLYIYTGWQRKNRLLMLSLH